MPRDIETIGDCPRCGGGALTCRFNHFEKDDLQIDSWEHKCPDCGYRETTAYRSDDPEADSVADPRCCPHCGRTGSV